MSAIAETVLETERLVLTTWLPEHINDLFALHGRREISQYLTADGSPETLEQAQARIALWAKNYSQHRMGKLRVIRKLDNALLGRAGFGIYETTGEPELGFALFEKFWGNGYAFEAACGLRDWIFEKTKHDHFIGLAHVQNKASLRVLEGIGLKKTEIKNDTDGAPCQFFVLRRDQWQDLHAEGFKK